MEQSEFRQFVRKRPGMYFGDPDDGSAFNHVIFELVANGIDQFLSGKATKVDVEIDHRNIIVEDDGPGLPFAVPSAICADRCEAEEYLEQPHFSPSARGHAPHVHLALPGAGLASVNAIADWFEVWSDDGKSSWYRRYEAGLPVGEAATAASKGLSGTRFTLALPETFALPDFMRLRSTLKDQVYLYPDFHLSLNGEDFHGPRGFLDLALLEFESLFPGDTPRRTAWHRESYDLFRVQVALIGDDSGGRSVTRSWVNGVESCDGGSHVDGLDKALTQLGWQPAVKLLHIIMEEPEYATPTAAQLYAPHIVEPVEKCDVVVAEVANWTMSWHSSNRHHQSSIVR